MASVSDAAELRLGQNSNGMLLSPWEFDRADFDENWRYELVNGILIVHAALLRNERDPNEKRTSKFELNSPSHP